MFIKQTCIPYVVGQQYGSAVFVGFLNGNLCFKPVAVGHITVPDLPFKEGESVLHKGEELEVLACDGQFVLTGKGLLPVEELVHAPKVAVPMPIFQPGLTYLDISTQQLFCCLSCTETEVEFDIYGKYMTGPVKQSQSHNFTKLKLGPRTLLIGYARREANLNQVVTPMGKGTVLDSLDEDGKTVVRIAGNQFKFEPRLIA